MAATCFPGVRIAGKMINWEQGDHVRDHLYTLAIIALVERECGRFGAILEALGAR
jgi:hypothetical protein